MRWGTTVFSKVFLFLVTEISVALDGEGAGAGAEVGGFRQEAATAALALESMR